MLPALKKLWHGETDGMTAAALIVGAASLASRLLGLVRDRMLAGTFGAGDALDAYYAAFRLPDLLYNLLIVGALSAGFIPVFTEYLERRGKEEAMRLAGQVLSVVAFALAIGSILLALFAPWVVSLLVPAFGPEKMEQTVLLTRIMMLSPVFLGISAVLGGVLQSLRRFTAFAFAPVLYNVGIIGGVLFLAPSIGVVGVAIGVVVGAILHMLLQASVAGTLGVGWPPLPRLSSEGVRRIVRLMLPRSAGLAVTQLNVLLLTGLASGVGSGAVAVFSFANNIQSFPFALLGLPFAIAAFPLLSRAMGSGDEKAFASALLQAMRKTLFFLLPAMALCLLLRAQIVRLVLGQGAFDWTDTIRTADTLAWFVPSLFAQALVALFARAFYARQDTWTPVTIGIVSEAVGIACAFWLRGPFGVAGLAMAFSVAAVLQAGLLLLMLSRRVPFLSCRELWPTVWKTSLACLVALIFAYPVRQWIGTVYQLREVWQLALQAGLTMVVGGVSFTGMLFLSKSRELQEVVRAVSARLWRKANLGESAAEAGRT